MRDPGLLVNVSIAQGKDMYSLYNLYYTNIFVFSRYGLFWLDLLMIKANLYYFGGISAYRYQVPLRGSKREL